MNYQDNNGFGNKVKVAIGTAFFAMMMLFNIQVGISDANISLFGFDASLSSPNAEASINSEHTCYDTFEECTWNCDQPIDCITCSRVDGEDLRDPSTCERTQN